MKIQTLAPEQAVGGILIHNIADRDGHKLLHKGHRVTPADAETLRAQDKQTVLVGLYEPGDVSENDAALRIARAVAGDNLTLSAVGSGRVNLTASVRGVFALNVEALARINDLQGITVATISAHTVVQPKKMAATVKTIGLAVPEKALARVDELATLTPNLLMVRPLGAPRVAVILSGSPETKSGVEKTFIPAIQGRVEDLGGTVTTCEFVEHRAAAVADAITRARSARVDCIILAGETSIMDLDDETPTGIRDAGGEIEVYGAPVEPGNLLLLAYADDLPILGAPGCVKSRDTNVVDLILPRLLAGERVTKRDIVALANGGLLI